MPGKGRPIINTKLKSHSSLKEILPSISLPSGRPTPIVPKSAVANVPLRAVPLPPLPPLKFTPVPKILPNHALPFPVPPSLPTPAPTNLQSTSNHKPAHIESLVQPLSISKSPHEVMIKSISGKNSSPSENADSQPYDEPRMSTDAFSPVQPAPSSNIYDTESPSNSLPQTRPVINSLPTEGPSIADDEAKIPPVITEGPSIADAEPKIGIALKQQLKSPSVSTVSTDGPSNADDELNTGIASRKQLKSNSTTNMKFQYLGGPQIEGTKIDTTPHVEIMPSKAKRSWLLNTVTKVLHSKPRKPGPPPFKFELSKEAARFNHDLLNQHGGDLDAVIRSSPFNTMSYGSEFKDTEVLEDLFQFHPGWSKMKSILSNGTKFPLTEIPVHERLGDLRENIKYGNHKSASGERANLLSSKLEKEVTRGWNIPILPSHILDLIDTGAEVAPMGMANQASINERGEIVYKDRLTHDQSWKGKVSGTSINSRVIDEEIEPLFYGHMITRLINYIVALRLAHPDKRILMRKDDFKSAYRRQHLNGWTALKTIVKTVWEGVTFFLISLRLTFGGKPNPSEWCCIAEPICDLSNDILNCPEWDPSKLHSPLQDKMPSAEPDLDKSAFHPALPLMMSIPILPFGKCDEFIDDVGTVGVDTGPDSILRLESAAPLAIACVARGLDPEDELVRDDFMCLHKMEAEGGLREILTILGWIINTRKLLISLPENKFIAWCAQIREILKDGKVSAEDLHTLIGRLNHAAFVIPMARHFLSRIRHLHDRASSKWTRLRISAWIRADLELWLTFLSQAYDGISLNLISFRQPTHIYMTDSCEFGLGGFSSKGKAWRWKIPENLLGRAHIGLLEFLAEVVAIWLDIIDGDIGEEDCALSMGDSSNGIGWMHKSNFFEEGETSIDQTAKLKTARKLAKITIVAKLKLYGQWFPGIDNIIPDILSRDWHLSDDELLSLLTHLFPSQLHPNFRLVKLPSEIDSFLCSVLQDMPYNKERRKTHKPSGFTLGGSGNSSCPPSASKAMTSWHHLMNGTGKSYASHSVKPSEKRLSVLDSRNLLLLRTRSEIPSEMWHRPSGLLYDLTQD